MRLDDVLEASHVSALTRASKAIGRWFVSSWSSDSRCWEAATISANAVSSPASRLRRKSARCSPNAATALESPSSTARAMRASDHHVSLGGQELRVRLDDVA